jgi:hypothetical protein
MSGGERLRGAAYGVVLLWLNAYVCRDWLYHPTAQMNTLYGYWAALARLADGWLQPSWWPYWDFGIPFEFTSAPLVPALAAAITPFRHGSQSMAVEAVSALVYCAAPVALFALAWALTRAPGYSFFAALFYSLLSPAQLLAPDSGFRWAGFLAPHRFMLQSVWDETPRAAALVFLLLFLLFLKRAIERRRPVDSVLAAILLALAMLASPFAAISAALSVLCLVTADDAKSRRSNLVRIACIALLAFALAARFLPPSLWVAMGAASAAHEPWSVAVFKIFAGVVVVWLTLLHFLDRRGADWHTRFFVLWAFAMSCGPVLATWLDRQILPQAQRFRIEMEPAVALAVVFGLRPLLDRMPRTVKAAVVFAVLSLAGEQLVHHRRLAKDVLYPADVTQTIEYRAARRIAHDLPGARVMLPGSIAHWANAFTELPQYSGSEGTMAYSQLQQRAMTAVYRSGETPEENARISLAWLKAYGAAAVVVSGPASREVWKPFARPYKFDGRLPALWTEEGVTAYRVSDRTISLAHVVPRDALVNRAPADAADIAQLDRYNAALDDPALPDATFEWRGRNRIAIHAVIAPGQAISVQVSYHPGWHATIDGRPADVHRDGLGLMWLRPERPGAAQIDMRYDGGWELRLCRWLGVAAILAAIFFVARGGFR